MNYIIKSKENSGSCLECGSSMNGRKGKKFCSLECKNSYNNRKNKNAKQYKDFIVQKLYKNYEILEFLISNGISHIGREELNKMGFDDSYITGHRLGRYAHEQCSCFDIVFCRSESKLFQIHRKEISEY